MNVLMVSSVSPDAQGGVASHLRDLTGELVRQGVEVSVFQPPPSVARVIIHTAFWGGQRCLNALAPPLGFVVTDRISSMRIQGHLRAYADRPPDVVHCHGLYAPNVQMGLARLGLRVPVVLTVHGYRTYEAMSRRTVRAGSRLEHYLLAEERALYAGADAVIAVDSRLQKHVKSIADVEPIVIPNGVDTATFAPNAHPVGVDRVGNRRVVLSPRVLNPKNGVIVAVRAIHRLLESSREWVLVIAGDGQQRAEIEKYVAAHNLGDHVMLLGAVPRAQMIAWYQRANVVVIPSIPSQGVEEATSIAALEAMACAKPVVASDIGGLREVVVTRKTGVLVPPGDDAALATAIVQAAANREWGQDARRHVIASFSIESRVHAIIALYRRFQASKRSLA